MENQRYLPARRGDSPIKTYLRLWPRCHHRLSSRVSEKIASILRQVESDADIERILLKVGFGEEEEAEKCHQAEQNWPSVAMVLVTAMPTASFQSQY